MTIGEGIARGGSAYLERQEKARQFDASLREKAREADQQAFVSLANAPRDHASERLSEERRQFDANLAERQRQFDVSNKWDDALNQQRIDAMRSQQEENAAKMAHYQQLEEQTRQAAADLKNERTSTMKGLYWLSRRNGGMTVSPEVLSDFTKNMKAPDLVAIKTAGFFYNEDGTVKSPDNDDNKEAMFGISYNYIDPQTGKIALRPDGNGYAEKVMVPKFQKDWHAEGDIFSPTAISRRLSSRGSVRTVEEQQAIDDNRAKHRMELEKTKIDAKGEFAKAKLDADEEKDDDKAAELFRRTLMGQRVRGVAGDEGPKYTNDEVDALVDAYKKKRSEAKKVKKEGEGKGEGKGEGQGEGQVTGVKADNGSDDKGKPTGYRYNKSRTKRIPVYADGTQGPVEDVK